MSDETPRTVQRHCDVAIVGGSAAGLAAALQLVRQRRSVIVVDSGEARDAAADHLHGYLGRDGVTPSALRDAGREEVRSYGGEVLAGVVTAVTQGEDGRFGVEVAGGRSIVARRILAATGIEDQLPDIAGLAEQWGRDVIHCPSCHGFEARDRRIVQIVTHPAGLHPTGLWRHLSEQLTVVIHDPLGVDPARLSALREAGVDVRHGPVRRVVTGDDGHLAAVETEGGDRLEADAVAVGPRFRARVEPFRSLGLRTSPHPSGLGDFVETDATGATSVQGLHAAGNLTDPSQQVVGAAADGSRVGAMIGSGLAEEDLHAAGRPPANQADWDHRYAGGRMWSGRPNGSLVEEVRGLRPGRALDVGAGEGGDALWLAEQGWEVTASDISARALAHLDAEAERRGLPVDSSQVDANALGAFAPGGFDLVSACYASIPRTPDSRGARNLIDAVAPGGTLLVVGHDLEPMRRSADAAAHGQAFDPDAYLRTDDIAAILCDAPGWVIETHATRPRPPGAASAAHHVDDVILRAHRARV